MAGVTLHVRYPYPLDTEKVDRDYDAHLKLLNARMQLPDEAQPYSVTRSVDLPQGKRAFYVMFALCL